MPNKIKMLADLARQGLAKEVPSVSRLEMSFKDVNKRIPELTIAANLVKTGQMSAEEYARLVNALKPVTPYEFVPKPATKSEAIGALAGESKKKAYGETKKMEGGEPADLRLDIPAYTGHGVWVNSVHRKDAPTVYSSTSSVDKPTMIVPPEKVIKVATGETNKSPFAVIRGEWNPLTEAEAVKGAQKYLNDPDWIQVGMDPERHSYFYDRKTMAPVVGGDQAIQIGPLVLVKNPLYADPKDFKFSGGGKVSQDAMHMAVMNQKVQKKDVGGILKSAVRPAIKGIINKLNPEEVGRLPFMDLVKQKQMAGEYKTPLKFERAPAKSKEEIRALAERMAPQMMGEFVRKEGSKESKSVAGLSRKEYERQKEMQTDIKRDIPEVMPVDPEEFKGQVVVGVSGDLSLAHADVLGINDVRLDSPVKSWGGPLYGINSPYFWASGEGAATGLRSTAARGSLAYEGAPVVGMTIKAPEGMGYALHTLDALLGFQKPELLSKTKLESLNRKIRAGGLGYGKFPHFVGFEDPDLVLQQAQHDPKLRTFISDTLMMPTTSKEYGLFHGPDVKAALTEPELRNVEAGATGFSMGRLFPEQQFRESSHPTYEVDIPGEFMGKSRYLMPYELSFPDTLKFARDNPVKGVSEYLRFKGSGPRQIADPQYIDELKMYEEAMKSLLGRKKGGAVHMEDGGLSEAERINNLLSYYGSEDPNYKGLTDAISDLSSKIPFAPRKKGLEEKFSFAGSVIPLPEEMELAQRAATVNPLMARAAARRRGEKVPELPMPENEAPATIKPYDPTFRQSATDLIQRGLQKVVPVPRARDIAQRTMGEGVIGVADFVPYLGQGMAWQDTKRAVDETLKEGNVNELKKELLLGLITALPGVPGTVAAIKPTLRAAKPVGKALANEAAYRIHQAMTKGEGPLAGALAGVAPMNVVPPKKLFRGITEENGKQTGYGTFALGKGLYSSADKSFAKKYGNKVIELDPKESFPTNPLVLENVAGGAPQAFSDWLLEKSGEKNIRDFNKKYKDPAEFVKQFGYDGVVAGDEIVKYKSEGGITSDDLIVQETPL
jgi:hypothetical protein